MDKSIWELWIGIVIGEFLVAGILGIFREGYNHLKMPLSALGHGTDFVGRGYSLWQIISGVLMIYVFIRFMQCNKTYFTKATFIGSLFLIFFALGSCVLSGIFPVDETNEMVTLSAKIHGYGSVLSYTLLNFVPLLMISYLKNKQQSAFSFYSVVACLLSIVFYVLIVLADKETFQNTFIANGGLWQRLFLFNMYVYLTAIFMK